MDKKVIIIGGAGFIGSHFTDRLLGEPANPANSPAIETVTLYDNFSSGREWHYAAHGNDPQFKVVRANVNDSAALQNAMRGHDLVIHLASNPDIAKAMTDPDIDFREGTLLTRQVVEAMRLTGTKNILYASGSGVYGDLGEIEAQEDRGPLIPSSTYGASKLAGEALIASYCAMFGLRACAFRFANVVGPRQTHGVGFDFIRSLSKDPAKLRILGDGMQSKSYIYVDDVIDAVLLAHEKQNKPFEVYNIGTDDYITVTEIAKLAAEVVGLAPEKITFEYSGGDRGWKGDVPIVRLNSDRIRSLGWNNKRTTRDAIRDAMASLLQDARDGRL